ncbi:AzlC family ABC transporter permease [Pukyongiella litopenaei]|uniref:Branched-chain amino acid ABC transporter permease n=1 Tax=Pukyongiella litopenaei TaxID=2605946 RepID=A0A2S0MR88_9RHOB|nr:AzlC family ABC transporter permease [Pukyongiella litopenaei]AVO38382.1 branched-chain amino acid ABC transporter permease [Pukyongiella litopenaei]
MPASTAKSFFWKAVRDSIPFVFVAGPFGLLFGVLATEANLDLLATMVFTTTVFAGAAQFTALQALNDHMPTLIVIISALAVNLRVAMYSAALTPWLGNAPFWQRALAAYFTVDQSYALSVAQYETRPDMSIPERMAYFFGTVALIAPLWYLCTLAGALLGARIPESWALDFALPIAFLAMIAPMLRTPAHVAAALVAIVTALLAAGLPYNLGLLVAGLAGMMAGARVEAAAERRAGVA